jgi:hypothetical protein
MKSASSLRSSAKPANVAGRRTAIGYEIALFVVMECNPPIAAHLGFT